MEIEIYRETKKERFIPFICKSIHQYVPQAVPVTGSNINPPPKSAYVKHVIAAIVGVALVALMIGGILVGVYIHNHNTKYLIKV